MTTTTLMDTLLGKNFKEFDKFFVGFDDSFNNMVKLHDQLTKNVSGYPPYNIKKIEDNKYVIELAIAGFSKTDIEIIIDNNILVVSGKTKEDDSADYVFKGIANRAFTRSFALNDKVEIRDANILNGMLKIFLEKIIPEHKKPKTIEVKESK